MSSVMFKEHQITLLFDLYCYNNKLLFFHNTLNARISSIKNELKLLCDNTGTLS